MPDVSRASAHAAPRSRFARAVATVVAALTLATLLAVAAAPSAQAQVSLGVDKAFMDTTCQPCKDFFRYANGAWADTANIPAAYTSIGSGREMYDRNQAALLTVLEHARDNAATEKDPTIRKLGYFYATTMDSARADREGWQPIAGMLKEIDAIRGQEDLRRMFATLQTRGASVPFSFGPEADPKQSTMNIGQIYQAGLGLPDRDYYFKTDPKSDTLRREYVAHLGRLFRLVGVPAEKADANAQAVMKLETALAESSMTRVAQRDPQAIYHKMSVRELGALAPSIDWVAFFQETGVPVLAAADARLDVSQPAFVRQLNHLVETTPLDDWKAYLSAHVLRRTAPWLSQEFFDESFRFSSRLTGATVPLPRWKRCAQVIDRGMGEALGKAYVEMMFPPSSKAKMIEMVNNLRATLHDRIGTRDWMSESTKKQAVKKLDAILLKIGYPDKWRDYTALNIEPDAPGVANVERASAFEAARENRQIGKPVDRMEWGMSPPTVNAYYNPSINEIVFPAGILMPPRFDPHAPDAVNYGAIGSVIGHEITHGFDDEGRQYDAVGNLKDWWTADDATKFKARAQKVVDEYDGFVAVDTLHLNGRLTLGENIADLGGLTIAYYALERSLQGKPREKVGGFTPEQLFFLGYAQGWRAKVRDETTRLRTLTDPHSPPYFRVNGPLENMPEFAKAFGCKAGDPMVREPDLRAEIW